MARSMFFPGEFLDTALGKTEEFCAFAVGIW